jgi:hypothetical protein
MFVAEDGETKGSGKWFSDLGGAEGGAERLVLVHLGTRRVNDY